MGKSVGQSAGHGGDERAGSALAVSRPNRGPLLAGYGPLGPLVTACGLWLAACGPLIEPASFPARPDSIRSADLLGPYDGIVVDADSDRPIAGATVAASWAFETGIGLHAPAGAREVVVETSADGRYVIGRLDDLPEGASARIRRFTLIVYHRGNVAWRSDRVFPGGASRRDFSQRGSRIRLDRWQPAFRHAAHLVFLGGGAKVHAAAAWELQAAALELDGERTPITRPRAEGAPATALPPLDISKLLSDDEIRGVTGYVGKFEDGKLTDLPTTEFYDSRHFKALGKPESYDVGLRVWRLGSSASEVQYGKLMSALPDARTTDEVGDGSFRAKAGALGGLVYLVRERGVVVSLTCGSAQCPEPAQLTKLAKLVESRLPDLPPEPARNVPPPLPEGAPLDDSSPATRPTPTPEVPEP
jgi:hypothetical protein